MHEWLEGLQKAAKRTAPGVGLEAVRQAETENGEPLPTELLELYRTLDGGEFGGDVLLWPLHAPEGTSGALEKSRMKLEGLPAAGTWRFGVKGPHRQLFAARKSALREQGEGGPLPGWAEPLAEDTWLYGTWDTETREMRLYRGLGDMLAVLVPPAEVEEFGDRTYARALSAVMDHLGLAQPEEEAALEAEAAPEEEAAPAELRKPAVEAAERRIEKLKASARKLAKKAAKRPVAKKAAVKKAAVKKAAVKKAAARKPAAKKAEARRPAAKKAVAKKPARKETKKTVSRRTPAKRTAGKAAKKGTGPRGTSRSRR